MIIFALTNLAAIHKLEFAVRGYERNGPIDVKTRQPHTPEAISRERRIHCDISNNALVKFYVLHFDAFSLRRGATVCFEQQLVVQAQLQLRHTAQVAVKK
jgi:hypothetical protein